MYYYFSSHKTHTHACTHLGWKRVPRPTDSEDVDYPAWLFLREVILNN